MWRRFHHAKIGWRWNGIYACRCGTIVERVLNPVKFCYVDTGCVVAFEPSVQFDIQQAAILKTALFGGEGLFFCRTFKARAKFTESLPFSRLAAGSCWLRTHSVAVAKKKAVF